MVTDHEARSSRSLKLSWPPSVNYLHIESAGPRVVSDPNGNQKSKTRDICTPKPIMTYNGVPREVLRKSQTLLANEIRVLDLSRGTHGDPLVGSLRKVRLSDPIVYEPLSYTWEDHDIVEPSSSYSDYAARPAIFLTNIETFINIGRNCEKALCSVRKATAERTIWIDSICVNQDDPEERSRQVDLMQQIFAKAFTVLVYLGQESKDGDSSRAMSLLGQPNRLREFHGLDQDERESLKRLFDRPYFHRMWIVQEVALAQNLELHCGPDLTHISTFAGKPLKAILSSSIAHPPWLKYSKHTAILPLKPSNTSRAEHNFFSGSWARQPLQAERILSLLFDTALCHCKDDRDRIFALSSLVNVRNEEWLMADYSLSTAQVYAGIAAFLATNGLAWDVLILAPRLVLNSDSGLGLPSWVPNWKMLGNASFHAREVLDVIKSRSHSPVNFSITNSGVITVAGTSLGPVITSQHGQRHMSEQRARMRDDHGQSIRNGWELNRPSQLHGGKYQSLWTLIKPTQSHSQESWECHIEFPTRCEPPSNVQFLAVMLEDHTTILILRRDDSLRDQYDLVESGMPVVWGVMPEEWAWDDHRRYTEISLSGSSQSLPEETSRLHDTPFTPDRFPRLRDYPELWSYNPATSAMGLTYKAMEQIRRIDLRALGLWRVWQDCAHRGAQILRDKSRLQLLIDEVNSLGEEDYRQIEMDAELGANWSLNHFLSLFIKDPSKDGPMEWPTTKWHGDQDSEETAALPLLMQWAAITYRFLRQLRLTVKCDVPWLELPRREDLYSDAMSVFLFHRSIGPIFTNGNESCGPDRASCLLRIILRQSSELSSPQADQGTWTTFEMKRYWDWRHFDSVTDQTLSILRHVQPDVTSLQAGFHFSTLDFRYTVAQQVWAAHGLDLRNRKITHFQIR